MQHLPLTSSQKSIWIGQKTFPSSPLYNMAYRTDITEALDTNAFTRAWNDVVATHKNLAIRVSEENGVPFQYYSEHPTELTYIDCSASSNAQLDVNEWIDNQLKSVFDLSGSLVLSVLFKVSDTQWVWFCNQHHLITDAWSYNLLWQTLNQNYSAYVNNKRLENSLLEKASFHFGDYAVFEEHNRDNASEANREHWASRSSGSDINLYGTRTSRVNLGTCRELVESSASQASDLQTLINLPQARGFNAELSAFQSYLALLAIYLYRASGVTTLSMLAPFANRSTQQWRKTPGLFIEVLPICVTINASDSYLDVLGRVKQEVSMCLRNTYPGCSSIAGQTHTTAVLNVIEAPDASLAGKPVNIQWLHSAQNDPHHAMRLHVVKHNEASPSFIFELNEAVLSVSSADRVMAHWWALVAAVASDPKASIGKHDIRSGNEPVVYAGNSQDRPFVSVANLVGQAIDQYPDDVAVSDNEATLSYKQLNSRIHYLVEALEKRKVTRGDRVALVLERSIDFPAVLLAIFKIGAAYIPIDPALPTERINLLVAKSDCKLVISTSEIMTGLNVICPVYELQSFSSPTQADAIKPEDNALLSAISNENDIAYIMFTSGSTGEPKGVVISQGALSNYISWASDYYSSEQRLCFPFYSSVGFDLTVTSLYVPLVTGGHIKVYGEQRYPANTVILDVVKENAVDIIKLTPAHLQLIIGMQLSSSRVKQLIVGGEDLKSTLANNILGSFSDSLKIHNEYGPTEATVGCIVYSCHSKELSLASIPIGRPIQGMKVKIVNEVGVPQLEGVAGEILLSGASLANGYWKNSDETQRLFQSTGIENNHIWYRSGDRARLLPNGDIQYLGRTDSQVKVNGVRVELGEVESVALELPSVQSVIALMLSDQRASQFRAQDSDSLQVQASDVALDYCTSCGLASNYPEANIQDGVCRLCSRFENYRYRADLYFRPSSELESIVAKIKASSAGRYDCILLLSGGKDSSYALGRLVDMGLRVLAYTLDNGYISQGAKQNIQRICRSLSVDHQFGKTEFMNRIFVDSLSRHSNVCHGCFKTIYTLSLQLADELDINTIFTGLSRGQFFETRLTEELFTNPEFKVEHIDEVVLQARKTYHLQPDEVKSCLDTSHLNSGELLEKIQFVDFYRYCDVDLTDMMHYLDTHLPWIRPADTGRSTNCLINDVGIYVHKKERGFHNYALPYSWDVRLGHKKRDEALDELNDELDESNVQKILNEIGYTVNSPFGDMEKLVLYFAASQHYSEAEVLSQMATTLPSSHLPHTVVQVDEMPINKNGKIDKKALPDPFNNEALNKEVVNFPSNSEEQAWVTVWEKILKLKGVDTKQNFFSLGGDSIKAIMAVSAFNNGGYNYSVPDLFENPTIVALASLSHQRRSSHQSNDPAAASFEERKFSTVDPEQLKKLANLLRK